MQWRVEENDCNNNPLQIFLHTKEDPMKLRALVLMDFDIPDGDLIEGAEEQKALQKLVADYSKDNKRIVYTTVDMRERRGDTQPDLKKMKFRQT
tara:strand:- start:1487 stop:1768 length:282 start_codon:yes stop_codon:yes gene_type:complete